MRGNNQDESEPETNEERAISALPSRAYVAAQSICYEIHWHGNGVSQAVYPMTIAG